MRFNRRQLYPIREGRFQRPTRRADPPWGRRVGVLVEKSRGCHRRPPATQQPSRVTPSERCTSTVRRTVTPIQSEGQTPTPPSQPYFGFHHHLIIGTALVRFLDCLEGQGYRSILVPVFGAELGGRQAGERRLCTVGNLYEATEQS